MRVTRMSGPIGLDLDLPVPELAPTAETPALRTPRASVRSGRSRLPLPKAAQRA